MDIRRDGFWATLTLNGKSLLLNGNIFTRGSIMFLVGESLKTLQTERSRLDHNGTIELSLRIKNKPFDTTKDSTMILGKAEEVAALLDNDTHNHGSADTPHADETYEQFYQRLVDSDYPQISAEYIAAQWFDKPMNPDTTLWLNDPKAIRFRVLNSRDEEFETALPSEYESLKNYVKVTYPEFTRDLVFRTA